MTKKNNGADSVSAPVSNDEVKNLTVELSMNVVYVSDDLVNFRVDAMTDKRQSLIDLTVNPQQAAVLGRALLAASSVCASEPPKPAAGASITDCIFPVTHWEVGTANFNGNSAIVLTIVGGTKLVFEMPKGAAADLGLALKAK